MRTSIGITVVIAIGLIWSIAAMSDWIPVPSAEMSSAATSPHLVTAAKSKSTSTE